MSGIFGRRNSPKSWGIDSPDTVRRKLKEQYAHIGYDIFCANHHFGRLPEEQALKSLKLFGQEVIPAFV